MEIQLDKPGTTSQETGEVIQITPENQQRGRTSAGHPVRGGRLPEDEQDTREQRDDQSTGGPESRNNVAQDRAKLSLVRS